jgi:hypothetical protein
MKKTIDPKKGRKELFHALRYLTFAAQIASLGRIVGKQNFNASILS